MNDAALTVALILSSSVRLVDAADLRLPRRASGRNGQASSTSALEGKMLVAAFASAAVALPCHRQRRGWALLAGVGASGRSSGSMHGFAAIDQRGNQIVSGAAINLVAAGPHGAARQRLVSARAAAPRSSIPRPRGSSRWTWPGARVDDRRRCRCSGPLYRFLLSGHDILTYLAFLGGAADRLRAIPDALWPAPAGDRREPGRGRYGRHLGPRACATRGVRDLPACSAALPAPTCRSRRRPAFCNQMTAGKGFIALAALVFAKWRPLPALLTCLLFGFLERGGDPPAGRRGAGHIGEVPVQAIQSLPVYSHGRAPGRLRGARHPAPGLGHSLT